MLLERKAIIKNNHRTLMALEKYEVELSERTLAAAKEELHRYIEENDNSSLTWGYFPAFSNNNDYPECKALHEELDRKLLSKIKGNFSLAFIRLAIGKPITQFGGLHIDVDIGVNHNRTRPEEIVRLLINIGNYSRTVEYVDIIYNDLKNAGIEISREKYMKLHLPKSIETQKVFIPRKEKNAIWVLRFWSSIIAHAGITGDNGHFLTAYGMYSEMNDYSI